MKTPAPRRSARALALLALAALACGPAPDADDRPIVAVSVLPQAWLVDRLAGDAVEVVVMIPPGASPATYEPGIAERRALERASLYVKVGHPHLVFEASWLEPLLRERPDLAVVDGAVGLVSFEHDPHLWLSPTRMRAMGRAVALALVDLAPAEADAIRANAAGLDAEIAEVDRTLGRVLSDARGKRFFVLHPAWGYLAEEHGLVQVAIQEHNREPDAHRVAALIGEARALGVAVIFSQPQFDAAGARVVAEEIGARVEPLDPLAADWPTNLVHAAERIAAEARG
ncbi:MAG TPA: zinc ABC transporter substrate-binding protein [Myxococcota bacterium]|nr:zinc ABC transporter substrate-binding protein [Myxococcota bacterium]